MDSLLQGKIQIGALNIGNKWKKGVEVPKDSFFNILNVLATDSKRDLIEGRI
jgi:hypothetical protein